MKTRIHKSKGYFLRITSLETLGGAHFSPSFPLENQQGLPVTLNQLKGRVVLLVPFLTSCQEECPITTAALLAVHRTIVSERLSKKVAILEITVDPGRDTPQRMTAYARLTESNWPLLTGSPAVLATLWHYFGIYYQKVPEGSPPGIDWETHLPYTYDVDHSDGFVLLDSGLHVSKRVEYFRYVGHDAPVGCRRHGAIGQCGDVHLEG